MNSLVNRVVVDPPSAPSPGPWQAESNAAVSDDELLKLSPIDLNLRLMGCPADEVQRLKQRRRTLKNRSFSAAARTKQLQQAKDLQLQREATLREIQRIKAECRRVKDDTRKMMDECEQLKKFAMERNIPIPPHLNFEHLLNQRV